MGGIDLIISHAGDFNVTNVTPYPAVVLTDNYSDEQEQFLNQRTLVSGKQLSVEQSARLLFRRLSGKQNAQVARQREECLDLENLLLF